MLFTGPGRESWLAQCCGGEARGRARRHAWQRRAATPGLEQGRARAGEGEFGIVHKAMWHGTLVAAKILKGSSAIALGDFRSEIEVLRKVHHPNAVQFLGAPSPQA
jgi:hypothetical protein